MPVDAAVDVDDHVAGAGFLGLQGGHPLGGLRLVDLDADAARGRDDRVERCAGGVGFGVVGRAGWLLAVHVA